MDTRTAAYLRERRKHVGSWNATGRVVSGAIGAVLGRLVPPNPTTAQSALFILIGAVGGVIIVETVLYAWRLVWTAPKLAYFEALSAVSKAERAAEHRLAAVEGQFEAARRAYAKSIDGLNEQIAALQAQIRTLESKLELRIGNQQFADVLTERYSYGLSEVMNWTTLSKGKEFSNEDFAEWNRREQEWTLAVRQLLEEHGCNAQLIAHFWNIHQFTPGAFHHFYHVNMPLSMFSERLNRLKSIIDIFAEIPILNK
jgi:hypothetical protein